MLHDFRFGLRVLLKNRAFTAVVVAILALGIGVNTAIFTIVNAVVFKGMPFDNPQEISFISSNRGGISYPDLVDFRERARLFKGLGAFTGMPADLSDGDTAAERVGGARMTANSFSLLGTQPLLGRAADVWSYPASYLCSAAIQSLAMPFLLLARRQHVEADLTGDDRSSIKAT